MKTLRILLLTPTALPDVTGNAMTVERWRRGLVEKGCEVMVATTRNAVPTELAAAAAAFRPRLVHVHHLFLSGGLLLEEPLRGLLQDVPATATPAGTDLNQDLSRDGKDERLRAICNRIRVFVVQNHYFSLLIRELLPRGEERIVHVPKSCSWLGDDPCLLREEIGAGKDDFIFFLPAGIRPVKGNLFGLLALEKVHERRPQIRAVFAGPDLDKEYSERFALEMRRLASFACRMTAIDPRRMRSAYGDVDVVLNTSVSEGLANSVIEAMAAGKPLLAADIEGNRRPVLGEKGERPCGLLYRAHAVDDFVEKAIRLVDDGFLRAALAQAARERAAARPAPEEEINGLLAAYRRALNK